MRYGYMLLIVLLTSVTTTLQAQDKDKQCQLIAALSGDFYSQRQEGKSLEQLKQNTPPEFMGSEFARTIELALLLAFSVDESLNDEQVETQVYDSCLRNSP